MRNDLTGKRFGRLVVVSFHGRSKNRHAVWNCICDCGEKPACLGEKMINGETKSCGCIRREYMTTHGQSTHPNYHTWAGMVARCHDPTDRGFKNYGGRGIKVCNEWRTNPAKFFSDMGERPYGTSIDRIDNNKGYYPGNCRWADARTQNGNRRGCVMITHNGTTQGLGAWARQLGIGLDTLRKRIKRHSWSIKFALETPVGAYRRKRKDSNKGNDSFHNLRIG